MAWMPGPDDHELLAEFARSGSETAFAALVEQYVGLVYSTALRFTSNPHHAQEITQAVFIILARKAARLSPRVVLSGWLYQAARLTAANFVKGEIRRQQREQEVYMQSIVNAPDAAAWEQLAPLLDEAMGRLGEADRNAVVLRFFQNKSAQETAALLGVQEETAQKRVERALTRLRKLFSKRGVMLTATAIAGAVSANSMEAAPVGLAKAISAVAVAKGAAAGTSTLTLVKGALKIMAWTKMKMAIVIGVSVLLAAGTATVTVREVRGHEKMYSWEVPDADFGVFYKAQPQVKILPTKFDPANGNSGGDSSRGALGGPIHSGSDSGRGAFGIAVPAERIIYTAYRKDKLRTVFETEMPPGKFDFIAKLVPAQEPHKKIPQDGRWAEALQKEITRKFGITGRLEMRNTDVMVLRPASSGVLGFKVSHSMPHGQAMRVGAGDCAFFEQPASTLIGILEHKFQIPVLDQTRLTGSYDYALKWSEPDRGHPNLDGLKQALHDQLGLELVPTNMPIEMLVVEKAR